MWMMPVRVLQLPGTATWQAACQAVCQAAWHRGLAAV
jgi:hypothetical protein